MANQALFQNGRSMAASQKTTLPPPPPSDVEPANKSKIPVRGFAMLRERHAQNAKLSTFVRAATTAIPERPSTSGGVASSKHEDKALKKMSRDDLHFPPPKNTFHSGTTYYNFPVPGRRKPAMIPEETAEELEFRKYGYRDSLMADTLDSRDNEEIGMALGSPSQGQNTTWNDPSHADAATERKSNESSESRKNAALPPKPKASKWKLFGGMFNKKPAQASTTFYKLQPEPTKEPNYVNFPSPPPSRGRRMNSERRPKEKKPDLPRSKTIPMDFDFAKKDMLVTRTDEFRDDADIDEQLSRHDTKAPEIRLEGGPLLDVEIPTIKMERYSVMFGSLLNPQPTASTSALLARRQATLDRLKSVNESIAELERAEQLKRGGLIRRATSPRHTASPSFSLFPGGAALTPKRLARSNTSPAALSPARRIFAPTASDRKAVETHTIMIVHTPKETSAKQPAQALHPKPETETSWRESKSYLVSPTSSLGDIDSPTIQEATHITIPSAAVNVPFKPKLSEPDWEMVLPPSVMPTMAQLTETTRPRARAVTVGREHKVRWQDGKSGSLSSSASSASSKSSGSSASSHTSHEASPIEKRSALSSNPPSRSDSGIALSSSSANAKQSTISHVATSHPSHSTIPVAARTASPPRPSTSSGPSSQETTVAGTPIPKASQIPRKPSMDVLSRPSFDVARSSSDIPRPSTSSGPGTGMGSMVGLWVSPKVLAQAAAAQMGSENANWNANVNASVRKPVGGTVAAAKEAALKNAAEQSIARQISNSREQRRLLVPQKLAGKRGAEAEYRDGVSDRREVMRKEVRRVPVAVDNMEKMVSMSGGLGGFGGAGNRRSEVGVLVGGAY